ncbi:hypothetical protein DEI93_13580 [Curtobacterium sp. MCBD17_035]|uniref:hypothetical protein n=1 Tax=Curtobacterium sp. MCBD17_035 TaxID=2175673 RepID=UPI000DA8E433|nr:hypothetical protein [Curtobacterium sp. MCBD17_035]WIB66976.1 hypothetical protein DEI93_13580 [Curtobacterium sp. MCBD17_035]
MAYVEYPIEHMDLRSLHLDVSNFRFAADQPSETAALNYLWTEDDAAGVADLILRDGYVDNEQPLVVFEDGKYVVVEGNRRVSALMALADPSLAPAHQEDIERMLRRFAIEAENLPQSIRVMVLPDRPAVAKILARLHIGQSKRGWSPDEQAKFVMAQLTDQITVEELAAQLPGIENVGRLVRMGTVRAKLRATTFDDPAVTKYAHGSRLRMSSFEYAYRQAGIRELIGLTFNDQSRVASWASTPAERAALERLLVGFKNGEVNTRRGLKPGTDAYAYLLDAMRTAGEPDTTCDADVTGKRQGPVQDGSAGAAGASPSVPVEGSAPDAASAAGGASQAAGAGVGTEAAAGSGETDQSPAPKADAGVATVGDGGAGELKGSDTDGDTRRAPNDPSTRVHLNLAGIDYAGQPLTMLRRLRELSRIHVYDFPAAATMLIRSVLEAAIKEHYGRSNGIDVTGELGRVMGRVRNDYQGNGQLANAISAISQKSSDAANVPGTERWFNMVSHSVNVDVNGRQVHEAWLVVLPLVRFLLHETRTR